MKVIFHDDFSRVYTSDPAASAGRMESIVEVITPHVEFVKAQPASEDQIAFAHDSSQIEYLRHAGLYPIAALGDGGAVQAATLGLSEPCFGLIRPPRHHASFRSCWGECVGIVSGDVGRLIWFRSTTTKRRYSIMFKRILVALKFGPASLFALEESLELARQNAAELHIFHALDYLLQETDENDPKLMRVRDETERRYKSEIEPLLGNLKNVSFKCRPADPALETCKLARDIRADLLVLGCHSHKEKMCMGRIDYVGMTILENSPCPVMLVPLCD